jgi:Spy/CpxP family protein refolding chaperone
MKFLTSTRIGLSALALGAAFTLSHVSFAAPKDGQAAKGDAAKGDKAGRRGPLGGVMKDLGLTDEQKTQIKEIVKDYQPKLKALREDTTLDRKAKREQMKTLREEMMTKIRTILTPEQQAKLDAAIAEKKAEGPRKDRAAK